MDAHAPIAPDDLVGAVNGPLDTLVGRVGEVNVHLGGVGHHAEAARLRAEEFDERLREDVLPRVLLHVVEPPRPIYTPAHRRAHLRRSTFDDVQHAVAFGVNALDHARPAERARVCGLSAARRVEGRAVERDDRALGVGGRDRGDEGVELGQVRVRVVEPFGSHLPGSLPLCRAIFLGPGGPDFYIRA